MPVPPHVQHFVRPAPEQAAHVSDALYMLRPVPLQPPHRTIPKLQPQETRPKLQSHFTRPPLQSHFTRPPLHAAGHGWRVPWQMVQV
jgi:hypothetical protein